MKKFFAMLLSMTLLCSMGVFLTACDDNTSLNGPSNEPGEHTCSYVLQQATEDYKFSNATCEKPAKYFYSCSCGESGSSTFEYGDPLPHGHARWEQRDGKIHISYCHGGEILEVSMCRGGVMPNPVCEVCGNAYDVQD